MEFRSSAAGLPPPRVPPALRATRAAFKPTRRHSELDGWACVIQRYQRSLWSQKILNAHFDQYPLWHVPATPASMQFLFRLRAREQLTDPEFINDDGAQNAEVESYMRAKKAKEFRKKYSPLYYNGAARFIQTHWKQRKGGAGGRPDSPTRSAARLYATKPGRRDTRRETVILRGAAVMIEAAERGRKARVEFNKMRAAGLIGSLPRAPVAAAATQPPAHYEAGAAVYGLRWCRAEVQSQQADGSCVVRWAAESGGGTATVRAAHLQRATTAEPPQVESGGESLPEPPPPQPAPAKVPMGTEAAATAPPVATSVPAYAIPNGAAPAHRPAPAAAAPGGHRKAPTPLRSAAYEPGSPPRLPDARTRRQVVDLVARQEQAEAAFLDISSETTGDVEAGVLRAKLLNLIQPGGNGKADARLRVYLDETLGGSKTTRRVDFDGFVQTYNALIDITRLAR